MLSVTEGQWSGAGHVCGGSALGLTRPQPSCVALSSGFSSRPQNSVQRLWRLGHVFSGCPWGLLSRDNYLHFLHSDPHHLLALVSKTSGRRSLFNHQDSDVHPPLAILCWLKASGRSVPPALRRRDVSDPSP